MAERKAINKYYPPSWDPSKGSINKFVGQHPLRDRARKLDQGILIIRFEMPFNIWCEGCGAHIGMGVRFNAEKKKIGMYYSTPILSFRMKCHLCSNWMEIHTDPKNAKYLVVSGAKQKNEEWKPESGEAIALDSDATREKLASNKMFRLEREIVDFEHNRETQPILSQIEKRQSLLWKDNYSSSRVLRQSFRKEKLSLTEDRDAANRLVSKFGLGPDFKLEDETKEDIHLSKNIPYHSKLTVNEITPTLTDITKAIRKRREKRR